MRWAATVALLLLSCRGSDPAATLRACDDPACRSDTIVAAWDADPAATWAALIATEDELELAGLVARLAAERPGALEGRCAQLPSGAARMRCNRLTLRPHLRPQRQGAGQNAAPPRRRARGPSSAALPLPVEPAAVELPSCADTQASECAFREAERLVLARGPTAVEQALGLCAQSDHGPDCAEHVLELAMPGVPPADATTDDDLVAARAAVERFRDAAGDATVGALYEDWFWSVWTTTAVMAAAEPRGDLLAALPAAAHPHLRFALVWRTLEDAPDTAPAALVAQVQASLAQPGSSPAPSGAQRPATIVQTRHSWNGERRLEGAVPAAWCMGSTRRAIHLDPAVDLQLAVLEALARMTPPPPADDFLALVGSDQPEIVRWTGARIGAMLDPNAAYALDPQALGESSELVQARLRAGKGRSGAGNAAPASQGQAQPGQ